jgi:hypothetical protein
MIVTAMGTLSVEWQKWFSRLQIDLIRLMSSYDQNAAGSTSLVSGTKVVLNDLVVATSLIRLNPQNVGAGQGFLSVTLQVGVGFTITSSNVLDNRTIFYEILEAF